MKRLRFHYSMKLLFDDTVLNHHFTLKCIPKSDERQSITHIHTDVYPNEFLSEDTDSFGNACIYGYASEEHHSFYFDVVGEAETGLKRYETAGSSEKTGLFRYYTPLTQPGPELLNYHRFLMEELDHTDEELIECAGHPDLIMDPGEEVVDRSEAQGDALLARCVELMHHIHHDFRYEHGTTGIGTTAEEAWKGGSGVCQDYAHIFLSLLRIDRIPCRYVTGMLIGTGSSHAWIEVECGGRWYALDPTNDLLVDDGHIRIGCGRDAKDCLINQGVFTGTARQRQMIQVLVSELPYEYGGDYLTERNTNDHG